MANNNLEEQTSQREAKRIWTKKLNQFLSDYFNWFIVGVVVLVLVSGYFFLLKPKYDQTNNYINSLSRQEEGDFRAKQQELNDINTLLASYDKIDPSYLDKLDAIAPVKKNKEELFTEINYLVSRSGLLLRSVALTEAGAYVDSGLVPLTKADAAIAAQLESVNIQITVSGSDYDTFKRFLATLENNLRLIDVVSLNFDPRGTATLNFNVYYLKQ
ncbi:MAG TPA: hypothetical protein VMD74_04415 [Candidatus Methylomirabilis sp.]|nr:hypothetical protein [Candidatus Methylomirabilis sp.]